MRKRNTDFNDDWNNMTIGTQQRSHREQERETLVLPGHSRWESAGMRVVGEVADPEVLDSIPDLNQQPEGVLEHTASPLQVPEEERSAKF